MVPRGVDITGVHWFWFASPPNPRRRSTDASLILRCHGPAGGGVGACALSPGRSRAGPGSGVEMTVLLFSAPDLDPASNWTYRGPMYAAPSLLAWA